MDAAQSTFPTNSKKWPQPSSTFLMYCIHWCLCRHRCYKSFHQHYGLMHTARFTYSSETHTSLCHKIAPRLVECCALTCDTAFLLDKIPQLLVSLDIKGALVVSNPVHPWEPQAMSRSKVSADDGTHIRLHLHKTLCASHVQSGWALPWFYTCPPAEMPSSASVVS